MAAVYDIEDLVRDIEALLQSKLDAEIDAVDAEKVSQGYATANLSHIDPAGYHVFAINDDAMNILPALGIFVANHSEQGDGQITRAQYTIEVAVILQAINDPDVTRKLLRYMKALKQVFEKNWGKINNAVTREKIETVGPVDFTLNVDSSDIYKIAGISITCVLG